MAGRDGGGVDAAGRGELDLRLKTKSPLEWLKGLGHHFLKPLQEGSTQAVQGLYGRVSMKLTRFLLRACPVASANWRALTTVA